MNVTFTLPSACKVDLREQNKMPAGKANGHKSALLEFTNKP